MCFSKNSGGGANHDTATLTQHNPESLPVLVTEPKIRHEAVSRQFFLPPEMAEAESADRNHAENAQRHVHRFWHGGNV